MRHKKAAMEMSMGVIVTIILLVSVLILGIFLVQKIFSSATSAVELSDQAITNELNKLFSEDKKVAIYPPTRRLEIDIEEDSGVGIVIKNLIRGGTGNERFGYDVQVADTGDCRETAEQIARWMVIGDSRTGIAIPSGEPSVQRVEFRIPTGTSLCRARFSVEVNVDGTPYQSEFFDVLVG